uniref:Uncharacterized protein n=1 Tax=Rhizochromulina marina TaxID=1034831 RepID=A0A7S2R9U6_9STRA
MVEDLKLRGNEAFARGAFDVAEQLYSEAIDLAPSSHVLWSNRAAARLQLKQHESALSDAEQCIVLEPSWVKGYHRRALALKGLERMDEAFQSYQEACRQAPEDLWVRREMKKFRHELVKWNASRPVTSSDHFVSIFKRLDDIWDRLSTLAYFWNASDSGERLMIFQRFLEVLAGGSTPADPSVYTEEMMQPLPTKNYEHASKEPISLWMDFFNSLESGQKVELFARLWDVTSEAEKGLIVKDLQFFVLGSAETADQRADEVDE